MNRTNLILFVILAIVFSIWLATMPSSDATRTAPAPRLFPKFNKEAVDAIVIDGGWKGMSYEYVRGPNGWVFASGGGFPVTTEAPHEFVEAVASIRRENLVGESADLRKTVRTGDEGRKVTVLSNGQPIAEFVVGKHPKGDWQAFFLRRADEDSIYRTKTVTDEEAARESSPDPMMGSRGPKAFDWAQYCDEVFKWAKTQIWNLDDAEIRELWLDRPGDKFSVKLIRNEEDNWTLEEAGKEPARADTSAVESITSGLAYLAFEEVVGSSDDDEARRKYGLDKPVITLVITLRKKVEKPDEPKSEEDDEKKDEEKKDDKKKDDEPQYRFIKRTIAVGRKVMLPRSIDSETGEVKEEELYAVKVSGDLDDPEKAPYIYLVNDYKIGPLKKTIEDLRLKEEEKKTDETGQPDEADEKDGADSGNDEDGADKGEEPKGEPKEEEPKEEEPKEEEPKEEEPKEEPKKDEPAEPGR